MPIVCKQRHAIDGDNVVPKVVRVLRKRTGRIVVYQYALCRRCERERKGHLGTSACGLCHERGHNRRTCPKVAA